MAYRERLHKRCIALLALVGGVRDYYLSCADQERKNFIETTIGAAIWYLPRNKKILFTGKISRDAILENEKSEDHIFPRKIAAQEILNFKWGQESDPAGKLFDLYVQKYGRFNYVSRRENKRLVKFQKSETFVGTSTAYARVMIELVDVEELHSHKISRD